MLIWCYPTSSGWLNCHRDRFGKLTFRPLAFLSCLTLPAMQHQSFFGKKNFAKTLHCYSCPFRVLVTGVLADRRPASLHFFRNFDVPDDHCGDSRGKLNFKPPPKPSG